ncbi:biotin carboxylase /acetyl-CoA carboxylase carboxyltransferase subunit alpha [Vagococcus fluvialis]|uniref:Biotin carboxylase n=1 Tax=Vagococcus fluvialis TaxID=2738 RepID=A0A369AUN2_9ENTE|nr:acetyl-CoA carboxylase biotin carboxylase subunit [Vagococcus fluvialis]MBO0488003.1 acetyl-CoA carboxylase biotin carboxylase subunit [Vagococcus fluvialis]MDT2781736.1 acetyl-CoA carboxylase biotin carboxylase subunit [Vagococcus fluvialis]NKC60024.1 acetyl-CoA carboxylase biotin carboxylase subunit [Vagococcus fluvialis]NKD50719.1 acetyl-CoA carboxylase biotin carboxylase subunit [Vagococcus fluvialis]RCX13092.1 biotin carboxylase /acetyl-CoA carboxylase carboxyltransferase subunit alpha
MFNKVLIANRGEIAVRIIRGCRELGIKTVAIFSEADRDALHVEMADEAICIGPAKATDSYLNMHSVLSAAIVSGAEAIHPGFGFLAENSMFAEMCEECQIKFIGPMPKTIDSMGNKINARKLMIEARVPVIPGSEGEISTLKEAKTIADEVGYPIMLKAAAGGGGKGIRKVLEESELEKQFQSAQQEALAAFGNGQMYIEKVIYPARHIEVQILGDHYGNIIHLGERDCSLQRSNQKVLEEAPAFGLSNELREMMGEAALKAAQAVNYENAGTIEFLVDLDNNFYFMEMNTRIQVEHPVTEMVTGVDIVKWQLKIAAGEKLTLKQKDITLTGHAIECRINAENPAFNFAPSPGTVNNLLLPSGGIGLRVDSAMYNGYSIPPFYDSMIAKVIVHGENRMEALAKMQRALSELVTDGLVTNQDFQLDLITHQQIIDGKYDTSFLQETFLPEWLK